MSPAFEVRQVTKRYGRGPRAVDALRGLSLRGEGGEVLGLLGQNGAGKTTTVKCLVGLVRPTEGRALVLGEDAGTPAARRPLGYMPEGPSYPAHLTAAEALDREGQLFGLARAERRGRVALLLERVGLREGVFTRRIATYSKGERARLGLALALTGDPRVVLLDEPTDGLDPGGRRAVRELLRALRDEGRAVLVNSHLLGEVEAICDRVVIIKAGRVVAEGRPSELLAARRTAWRIGLATALEPADLAAIAERFPGTTQAEATLTAPLEREGDVDALVDLVRGRGGKIRELRAQQSLEDVFLDLVSADEADAAGARA